MKSIQPFIDLGWHTVPLTGEIARLSDGTKTIPGFCKGWKEKYTNEINKVPAMLGGVLTGELSNIIAIDCDNQATFDLFYSQCKEYKFIFFSRDKPKGGGTIIFQYLKDLALPTFSLRDGLIDIDIFSNDGFVYLPSDSNTTKEEWIAETHNDLPLVKEMPPSIKVLLMSLYKQYTLTKDGISPLKENTEVAQSINYLAPQIEMFIAKGFSPSLFRIITPKDFRSLEQYIREGYLHPKNIPDGRGSEYLSKVSAILGADQSISTTLYYQAIKAINELWTIPMDAKRLDATIAKRMLEGQVKVNGINIWKYDETWKNKGLSFSNKLGEAVEVFFDDVRRLYYMVNHTRGAISSFSRDNDVFSYIETVGNSRIAPRKKLKTLMPMVRTVSKPNIPFGAYMHNEYTKNFNLFQQTPALAILNNPKNYKAHYIEPVMILNYLESLIPNKDSRDFTLKFLRHKLLTFDYSPIVLYFLGVPGSGKDTFIEILSVIMGSNHIAKPSVKEFLEQYNGWLVDSYFVQLDEYGNQLVRTSEKAEALGKLLAYSGKSEVQIRQMRTDGYLTKHFATFVLTANSNPLMVTEDDRRVHLIETPNKLQDQGWVKEAGGIAKVHTAILEQVNDFCYYLATEVSIIASQDYVSPPESLEKSRVIAEKLGAGAKLVYMLRKCLFSEMEEIAYEHSIDELFKNSEISQINELALFDLYTAMTDGLGTKRALSKFMMDGGFVKFPSTLKGNKTYVYKIPFLSKFRPNQFT